MTRVNVTRRVANRVKREMIARVPSVNRRVRSGHEANLAAHRASLPRLAAPEQRLVETVRTYGVAVTDFASLGLSDQGPVTCALSDLVIDLAGMEPGTHSSLRPTREQLLGDIRLWQCGLDQRLLDLAESYIGLPVTYYGAAVFRQVADGKSLGTRQWHRDIEDHRVFKILVWLNDVGPRGGAFQYVPKKRSDESLDELGYVAGYVTDDTMKTVVAPDEWVKATGPQWTAVLADTAQILHRGSSPEDHDRYSVTLTWTSRRPLKTMPPAEDFTPAEAARIREGLDSRQLACLPAWLQA